VLVDSDETKVEDDSDEAEAECDAELRDAEAAIRAAASHCNAEIVAHAMGEHQKRHRAEDLTVARIKVEAALAKAEAEHVAKVEAVEHDAAERAAHWRPRWTRPSPIGGMSIGGRLA
jgi:hypothetical protein